MTGTQYRKQFGWEGAGNSVIGFFIGEGFVACFGGVGQHRGQVGGTGQFQHLRPLGLGSEGSAD